MAKIETIKMEPWDEGLTVEQLERPKTLAIIGSRNVKNRFEVFESILNELKIFLPVQYWPDLIITGGAKGVDTLAEGVAERLKIKTEAIRPDYANFGKAAPIIRNKEIINRADYVLAFWNGQSRGTKMGIDYARSKNKHVKVIPID